MAILMRHLYALTQGSSRETQQVLVWLVVVVVVMVMVVVASQVGQIATSVSAADAHGCAHRCEYMHIIFRHQALRGCAQFTGPFTARGRLASLYLGQGRESCRWN